MPLDKDGGLDAADEARRSWDGGIEEDARAAYAESAGRAAKEPSEPVAREPAVREPVAKEPKEEVRDDGRKSNGQFAPKEPAAKPPVVEGKAPAKEAAEKPVAADPAVDPAAAQPTASGPPSSFSVKTKAEWNTLPEHVRADIVKREAEMGQGLKALQEFKDLKPYQELAVRHNTTIPKALDHFVRMETLIKQNPQAGMAQIAVNMGMSQPQAAKMFAEMAQKLGGAPAPAGGQPAAGAAGTSDDPLTEVLRPVLNQLLSPMLQQVEQMRGSLTAREQADRNAHAQSLESAEAAFKSDPTNLYYEQLEPTMVKLVESGMVPMTGNHAADMKTAYDMAARLHPEVNEALIEQRLRTTQDAKRKAEQEAVDKAKGASRSLTGSRMPGSTTKVSDEPESADDLEADVIRAFRQHTR